MPDRIGSTQGRSAAALHLIVLLAAFSTAAVSPTQAQEPPTTASQPSVAAGGAEPPASASADAPLPARLRDRGPGIPISSRGTYVSGRQWLVEVSFESTHNKDFEYDPAILGLSSPTDSAFGRYMSSESRLSAAYGLSDRFAVEVEARAIRASLDSAPDEVTGLSREFTESGVGQVRGRLNWRWAREKGRRPEFFSYGDIGVPHDTDKPLTGTSDWVFDGGLGAIRGYSWGTMTARLGFEYDTGSESQLDFHEYAVEYLRRLAPDWRLFLGYIVFEGDEANLVTELQWTVRPNLVLRLGNRLGVVSQALSTTSNSADWAPTVGILFNLGAR
jgi:hypothetical protein